MPRHQTPQRNPRQRLARDDQHGLTAVPNCQPLPRDRVGRGRGDRGVLHRICPLIASPIRLPASKADLPSSTDSMTCFSFVRSIV